MSEHIDLSKGIKTKWNATSSITSVIPTARLFADDADGSPALPYAVFKIVKAAEPIYQQPRTSGEPYIAQLRAMFRVFGGSRLDAGTAADAVTGGLNTDFTVPNSTHMDWCFEGDIVIKPESMKAGDDVYVAEFSFTSMLQRAVP